MFSIRFHLILMIAAEFAGFLFAAGVIVALWGSGSLGESLWLTALIGMGLISVGVGFPRFIFRRILPARCPETDCDGRSFPEGKDPITYRCQTCGHVTETAIFESDSHDFPNRR